MRTTSVNHSKFHRSPNRWLFITLSTCYNLRLALSIGEIPNDPFTPSTQTWMGLSLNPSGLKQAGLYPFLWPLISQGGGGRNKEAMGPPEETQCNLPSRASNILGWQEKLCRVLWHGMLLSLLPQSRGAAAMMSWGDKPDSDRDRAEDKEAGRMEMAAVWRWTHLRQTLYMERKPPPLR